MTTITIKNIPDDLYERLKLTAEKNRRSINKEIIVCIERAVGAHRIYPDEMLAEARYLREKTSAYVITGDEFSQAKTTGRL